MRKCALSTVQGACSIHCFDLAQLSSKKHIWKKSEPEAEFRMESIERIIKSKKKKLAHLEVLVQYWSNVIPGIFLITIPVSSMPNKGGSLANEKSFPDKSAKTISTIRMNMVPPGGSAIEPAKNKKYTFLEVHRIFSQFFPKIHEFLTRLFW